MAAGKNDVIKLLPPLTLSESEARSFLSAFDAVLADCHGPASKNWGVVREIATATLRRRASRGVPAIATAPFRGNPVDPSRGDVCLLTGATGFIGGHLAERLVQEGNQVRCLVRSSSDTSRLDELKVEIAVGDLTSEGSLARAAEGCRYVIHCGALVSDWATAEEISRINLEGTRNLLKASVAASVQRFVHFSTTDIYGYPGGAAIDETHAGTRFRNWYSHTKLAAEVEVRRVATAHALDAVILRPATVYGPRSTDVVGEIARAIRGGNMVLVMPSTSPMASTPRGRSSPTASPRALDIRRSGGACRTGWRTASGSRWSTATECCVRPHGCGRRHCSRARRCTYSARTRISAT
jgi:putative NADH-flavin reductase